MNSILNCFVLDGAPVECAPYGNGHINQTYRFTTDKGHAYILQKINNSIFRNVPGLMNNISAVTEHLRGKGLGVREALTLVPTKAGGNYIEWTQDAPEAPAGFYRVYEFITDSLCMDRPETAEDFRQSAIAFGEFQHQLADFDASTLTETIPRFHDTVNRFKLLHDALDADPLGRVASVAPEIDFALQREAEAAVMLKMQASGELPLRVTHNDTKLNNVMLDAATRKPLCVIDLDTVMPGLAGNDFGDSIRFGASTAAEDEKDLSKVEMSLDLFRAYANGFLSACGNSLTPAEIETLPMGAKLMTLECGIRFLTDYIMGDTYFRIHYPEQNLDRTRTQFKLVADMEKKWSQMAAIIQEEKQ